MPKSGRVRLHHTATGFQGSFYSPGMVQIACTEMARRLLPPIAPRLLGCLLDVDSVTLGRILTGKGITLKAVMVEHKEAVAEALQAIAEAGMPLDRGSL